MITRKRFKTEVVRAPRPAMSLCRETEITVSNLSSSPGIELEPLVKPAFVG